MDAIQKDVDSQEAEPQEEEQVVIAEHDSEIERIAQNVHENVVRDEEEGREIPAEAPPQEDFSNPLTKKSEDWYVTAKVNGEEVDVKWDEVLS